MQGYLPRHAEARVRIALKDTRVVAIVGPRQSGKTTLSRHVAADDGRPFITLDDAQSRLFANDDPVGFMRNLRTAVIDEIQRAPELVLEIKKAVDEDPQPGRFLITGSIDLFRGTMSPDSLAGRVETVELLPFSQAEIARHGPPTFLERAFLADFPEHAVVGPVNDLADRVLAGGFPEALRRIAQNRRGSWLRSYAKAIAERDIANTADVLKRGELSRLIGHLAVTAGQLINNSRLAGDLGVDGKSVQRWITLLEHAFLVRRLKAWHRNELTRLVKAPKLHFLDSGLLAAVLRVDSGTLVRNRQQLGPLLESFVHSELAKAVSLSDESPALFHYRDKSQFEVDFVLERFDGMVVGIEVKARATVRPSDFKGLTQLKVAVGEQFACGILLHDGDRIQRVAPKLFSMPVSVLWET